MKSKQVKEARDKKAVFTARFSKENMKAKWYFKRDVSSWDQCYHFKKIFSTLNLAKN
jgi:hypothetical protein